MAMAGYGDNPPGTAIRNDGYWLRFLTTGCANHFGENFLTHIRNFRGSVCL
jgi:hypothetical protein